MVVKSDDSIWFTDPSYGTGGDHEGHRAPSELPHNVYRIDGKTGSMTVVADDFDQPNGLCFSQDEKKLYITDTGRGKDGISPSLIRVYDVTDGGKLVNGKLFHDFSDTKGGLSDDIRCDEDGNIWSAGGWAADPLFNGVAVLARWRCHRAHCLAGDRSQSVLWRPRPQPALHLRLHFALRG